MNAKRKIILEAIVGSTVHGTAVQDGLEDLDLMAVVIEDMKSFAGFNSSDTWVSRTKPTGVRSEAGDVDHVAYGLRKYLSLALKGNPSILLALFVPDSHVRECSFEGLELRALAPAIVSKQAYMPFRGYMRQQHERQTELLKMTAAGAAIERKHHKDVAELVKVCKRRMRIGGFDVPVASLPYTLASDAGALMAAGEEFSACYWDTAGGRVFGLRSVEGGQDVSAIAQKYGGGGHARASGFTVPRHHQLAEA